MTLFYARGVWYLSLLYWFCNNYHKLLFMSLYLPSLDSVKECLIKDQKEYQEGKNLNDGNKKSKLTVEPL
jgi:hypothetical protein